MSQPKPQQVAKEMWKATSLALLKDDEVDSIYARLAGLAVPLDDDPLAYGPKRLQEKTAHCRKFLSETERLFLDVSHRLHKLKRNLRAAAAALELSTKYLYATDPEVRAGRNIADRDAFAAIKLKDEWMHRHALEQQVLDMEAVMLVIKAKRSDLRDTQGRIRDQVRLCGQELELGGRWGTKRPNAPDLEPGQGFADGTDVQSVLDLIEEMGGEGAAEIALPTLADDADDVEETPPEETPVVAPVVTPVVAPTGDVFVHPEDKLNFDLLDAETPKTAADVLPSNGSSGDDIDRMINGVQIPSDKTTPKKKELTEQDFDSLLEMFE
jgi:hypothetical protein